MSAPGYSAILHTMLEAVGRGQVSQRAASGRTPALWTMSGKPVTDGQRNALLILWSRKQIATNGPGPAYLTNNGGKVLLTQWNRNQK